MNNIINKTVPAGSFADWLKKITSSDMVNRGIQVPCSDCNACCRSSFFIHVEPDEFRTLRKIPKELLFPAPFLSESHKVLGYDKHGNCPMFNKKCTIYKSRPRACRNFDCRILAAAGLAGRGRNPVFQQARRWEFSFPAAEDRKMFSAVRSAASFLTNHPDFIQKNKLPTDKIQLSMISIKIYKIFLKSSLSIGAVKRLINKNLQLRNDFL